MRHPDNDIFHEITDSNVTIEPTVHQTMIWDITNQKFVGPSSDEWVPSTCDKIKTPTFVDVESQPKEGELFTLNEGGIKIEDGQPLLLTICRGAELVTYKFISERDEMVRLFRSQSHNRFVALFVTTNALDKAVSDGNVEKTEFFSKQLSYSREALFSQDELDGFDRNIEAGKNEFFSQLNEKMDGRYVAFHRDMFNGLRIGDAMAEYREMVDKQRDLDGDEQDVKDRQMVMDKLWQKLKSCYGWRKVKVVEAFWHVYVRSKIN